MSAQPVVLVTGAARGLGRAVAASWRADAAGVHVVHRSPAPELADAFGSERVHHADLTVDGAAGPIVQGVLATDGRLDVLVHAVGEYATGSLETTGAQARRMLDSNLVSAVSLFDAARPALRAARGCAVFFGSAGLESLRARRHTALYTAAKTALLVYARSLALEEAPHGVRVNVVSPGVVPHAGASADTLDPALQARIPMGRVGRPEDIAAAVRWLASAEAAHVTGQNLDVAGGWML